MKQTPWGKRLTKSEFFVKKNRFLPDASQNSESAAAGGESRGISVLWVQRGIGTEFSILKIGDFHTLITHLGRKMQKPHFSHHKLVFALTK